MIFGGGVGVSRIQSGCSGGHDRHCPSPTDNMGSQTLEILRQGVWASLTGGWFYDPHQSIFCNIVHLYLWLFLLCTPFVAYLYFPDTWLTWSIYCLVTSLLMLTLKVANMALHRLYDRAQTMSSEGNNIKQHFFKVTNKDVNGQ